MEEKARCAGKAAEVENDDDIRMILIVILLMTLGY